MSKKDLQKNSGVLFVITKKREGQCFEVVGRCTEEQTDISALPMWNIKFEDGTVIGAYPEECNN